MNILFLTLRVFSATGGIEKVCRIAGKALDEIREKGELNIYSLYDTTEQATTQYFPRLAFKGFKENRVRFGFSSIRKGTRAGVVILSHVNLLLFARFIQLLSPKTKIILITHGIEIWKPLPAWKKKMLAKCDLVICVSRFTKDKILKLHKLNPNRCVVLNNCLDPFLQPPQKEKDKFLLQRYGLQKEDKVLLTLSRLSAHDRDKGYEKVLVAMQQLSDQLPYLKYLIVGKYKDEEKQWLDDMIREKGLHGRVVITGFVPDEALAAHFGLADLYVMPSTKEGFGIIFIEAMFYGLPVIAGNKDGSVDAVANGELGLLVDPYLQEELTAAIKQVITNKDRYIPAYGKVMKEFGYPVYKRKLQKMLEEVKIGG